MQPPLWSNDTFVLDDAMIRSMYTLPSLRRHVHVINGLQFELGQPSGYNPYNTLETRQPHEIMNGVQQVSPCTNSVSRWVRTSSAACEEETALDAATLQSVRTALETDTTGRMSAMVRDVIIDSGSCTTNQGGVTIIGSSVTLNDNECWQHSHANAGNVYDFTQWTLLYPGVKGRAKRWLDNPIRRFAVRGSTSLDWDEATSPEANPMQRWRLFLSDLSKRPGGYETAFPLLLGRLGDTVAFSDLPIEFQTAELAAAVGATVVGGGEYDGSEACGSPGEVASDARNGHNYKAENMFKPGNDNAPNDDRANLQIRRKREGSLAAGQVWSELAVNGADQLRQKVAWALSQQYVVSGDGFPRTHVVDIELWTQYHDIFVRHAFANLRDVLREVAYSPMQGKYLTFIGSRGFARSGTYPDENFAREFMELFTIGLVMLKQDGTPIRDAAGHEIATYTNEDVMNFARSWTGFKMPNARPNMEQRWTNVENLQDPMELKPRDRDAFPKTDLFGGHIGDGTPLCVDMPAKAFLRPGAKYVYRGWSPICNQVILSSQLTVLPQSFLSSPSSLSFSSSHASPSDHGEPLWLHMFGEHRRLPPWALRRPGRLDHSRSGECTAPAAVPARLDRRVLVPQRVDALGATCMHWE